MRFETLSVHGARKPDPTTGALSTPIYQTSTFVFEDIGKTRGYDYSRTGNPTRRALEESVALLEGGKSGAAFATGMAAETTVAHLLRHGDHVICGDDVYGGTYRLFDTVMKSCGVETSFVRLDSKDNIEKAVQPNTRMIWLETPSNPLLNIVDVEMVTAIARRRNILTVADNTFASPYLMRPLELGVDIVVHSTTKYLNGHSDVVGGAVVAADQGIGDRIQYLLNAMGTGQSPFDSWLVLRGIKTLAPRMRVHIENAGRVAGYLVSHPKVGKVYYPGLPQHPGHEIAKRQMKGFGGIISFEAKGGLPEVNGIMKRLCLFSLAESLGGTDSLVEHPATMSHASMPAPAREKAGIGPNLIRLSIGLENWEDLIEDLEQALG